MKKRHLFTFIIFLAIGICIKPSIAFAQTNLSDESRAEARQTMLDYGFDEGFIQQAPDSELQKYLNSELVSKETEYYRVTFYNEANDTSENQSTRSFSMSTSEIDDSDMIKSVTKISKEQCELEVAEYNKNQLLQKTDSESRTMAMNSSFPFDGYTQNITNKSWIQLIVASTRSDLDNRRYTLSADAKWLTVPHFTLQDVFSIGHDTNLTAIRNSGYFFTKAYCKSAYIGETGWHSNSTKDADVWDTGGVGFIWKLPKNYNSRPEAYSDYYAYMSYEVNISDPNYNGHLSCNSCYAHQETAISMTPSFSIPPGGSLNLNSANKYDPVYCYIDF